MRANTTATDIDLYELYRQGEIIVPYGRKLSFEKEREKIIQPSSWDLHLGSRIWLMKGSVRPYADETIEGLLHQNAEQEFPVTRHFKVLRDSVYVAELQEALATTGSPLIRANPKSSTGRTDLQARLLADRNTHYDSISGSFVGKLYVELVPNSFHCALQQGVPVIQMRYSLGDPVMSDDEIRSVFQTTKVMYTKQGRPIEHPQIDGGLVLTIDLNGKNTGNSEIVGYRARKYCGKIVNLQKKDHHWEDFFEPIARPKNKELLLEPGYFYLLSTQEAVAIPPGFAGELTQFDSRVGHITSHYAGFFDPGFGYFAGQKEQGNTATLEVRVHNRPEILRDGQPIAVLQLERMNRPPASLYGEQRGSNYGRQIGVRLGKYFV